MSFFKYCNIFHYCKSQNKENNSYEESSQMSPPSQPPQYLQNQCIHMKLEKYLNQNTVFNPFVIKENDNFLFENNKLLHEECLICLEENYTNTCIKIQCCNKILHKECFKNWCISHKKITCPICQ